MANQAAARAAADDEVAQDETNTEDLASLQEQLAAERRATKRAREQVARTETEANTRIAGEQAGRFAAEEAALDQALDSAKTRADQLEEMVATALEEGRSKDHAKLTRELSQAATRLENLTASKQQYEARRKQQPQPGARGQVSDNDPRLANVTPPSRAWLKAHPEYLNDPKQNAKLMQAHYKAVEDDIAPDSDEYFEAIERDLGLIDDGRAGRDDDTVQGGADVDDPISEAGGEERRERKPIERRGTAAARAIPPNRGGGSGAPVRKPGAIDLTPDEKETAEFSYPDEFARNPADAYRLYQQNRDALIAEGKLAPRQRR